MELEQTYRRRSPARSRAVETTKANGPTAQRTNDERRQHRRQPLGICLRLCSLTTRAREQRDCYYRTVLSTYWVGLKCVFCWRGLFCWPLPSSQHFIGGISNCPWRGHSTLDCRFLCDVLLRSLGVIACKPTSLEASWIMECSSRRTDACVRSVDGQTVSSS